MPVRIQMIREVPIAQNPVIGHDDQTLHHIFELADIAGPVMVYQILEGIVGKPVDPFFNLVTVPPQKVIEQPRDILFSLP